MRSPPMPWCDASRVSSMRAVANLFGPVVARKPRLRRAIARESDNLAYRPRRRLLRLRNDPDVGLRRFPVAEGFLRLVVGDGAGDDHVLALLPVDGGGHLVLRGELQRV